MQRLSDDIRLWQIRDTLHRTRVLALQSLRSRCSHVAFFHIPGSRIFANWRLIGSRFAYAGRRSSLHRDPALSPAPSWTGIYVGASGGYGWGEADFQNGVGEIVVPPPPEQFHVAPFSVDLEGPFAGGQLGYRHQFGALVVGVEGSLNWASIDGSKGVYFDNPQNGEYDGTVSTSIEWFGTALGQGGLTVGNFMIFAQGGIAFGGTEVEVKFVDPPDMITASGDDTRIGYAVGAGAAARVTPNLSAELGYLFVDLGEDEYDFDGPQYRGQADIDYATHLLRFGLNYKLW